MRQRSKKLPSLVAAFAEEVMMKIVSFCAIRKAVRRRHICTVYFHLYFRFRLISGIVKNVSPAKKDLVIYACDLLIKLVLSHNMNWYLGAQQNLMNYLTSFSSMIISLEPFNSVEKYLHWLRDLQHQYSDLNSYLCNRWCSWITLPFLSLKLLCRTYSSYKTSVLKSEFESTSPNLIGSLVKLFYSSDGILYSGQCHTGRIVQRRSSHIGESNIRWEHLVHFKR